ncbi:hypothetical protein GGR01_001231 [Acetobacter oeni]|nr:hypothetical protein [Acetobacter oeni]
MSDLYWFTDGAFATLFPGKPRQGLIWMTVGC